MGAEGGAVRLTEAGISQGPGRQVNVFHTLYYPRLQASEYGDHPAVNATTTQRRILLLSTML